MRIPFLARFNKQKTQQAAPTRLLPSSSIDKKVLVFKSNKDNARQRSAEQVSEILRERQKLRIQTRFSFFNPKRWALPSKASLSRASFKLPSIRGRSVPSVSVPKPNWRWLIFAISSVLIAIVVGFGIFLYRAEVFVIQDVQILGNQEISDLQIISALGDLKGRSLLQIYAGDLEEELLAEFPYIRDVFVDKVLPGMLRIRVEERFPEFAYLNMSGVYLVDRDKVVVEVLGLDQVRPLTSQERLIMDGYGDINADYVFAAFISDIADDAELERLNWDQVPDSQKAATLEWLRQDIRQRVDALLAEKVQFLARAGFSSLPQSQSFDADIYQIGQSFPSAKYDLVTQVNQFLSQEGIEVQQMLWISDFSLETSIFGGVKLMFSAARPFSPQVEALQAFRATNNIQNVRVVDLRSEIIAVR